MAGRWPKHRCILVLKFLLLCGLELAISKEPASESNLEAPSLHKASSKKVQQAMRKLGLDMPEEEAERLVQAYAAQDNKLPGQDWGFPLIVFPEFARSFAEEHTTASLFLLVGFTFIIVGISARFLRRCDCPLCSSESDHTLVMKKALGSGAYGTAWLVERRWKDQSLKEEAVLKMVSVSHFRMLGVPENEAMLETELLLRSTSDIRICNSVLGIERSFFHVKYKWGLFYTRFYCLEIEYCKNGELYNAIPQGGFREDHCLRRFFELVEGVEALHRHNIIHRDLKPANIFISGDGHLRIGDLGLGHRLRRGTGKYRGSAGTPGFMAPEMYENDEFSKKSDVWSLGWILFQMATGLKHEEETLRCLKGKYMPSEDNDIALLLLRQPSWLDNVWNVPQLHNKDQVLELCRLCIQMDPEARPSARELLQHRILAKYRDSSHRISSPATPPPLSKAWSCPGPDSVVTP